jgi:hypothetical protein
VRHFPVINAALLLVAVTLAAPSVVHAADAAGPDASAAADAAQTADQGAGTDAAAADSGVPDQFVKLDTIRPRPPNPEGCECRMGLGARAGTVRGPLLLLALVLVVWGWRARR